MYMLSWTDGREAYGRLRSRRLKIFTDVRRSLRVNNTLKWLHLQDHLQRRI